MPTATSNIYAIVAAEILLEKGEGLGWPKLTSAEAIKNETSKSYAKNVRQAKLMPSG